jgi:hypothetical protein
MGLAKIAEKTMTDELHALFFFARATSILIRNPLLAAIDPKESRDSSLLRRLELTLAAMDAAE